MRPFIYKLKKLYKDFKDLKKSPFKNLTTKYYFGKLKHGTPYFYPRQFHPSIISIKQLKLRSTKEQSEYKEKNAYADNNNIKFKNYPLVRRTKYKIVKFFNRYYYISIGYPIRLHLTTLGWKDKYNSPRFEWSPAIHFYFFYLQFCIWFLPKTDNIDKYWEMYFWYKHYSDSDLKKAEETWEWVDPETEQSTWDNTNLK